MSESKEVTRQEATSPDVRRDEAALLPPIDVVEDDTGITLYADLPGVSKDRLEIKVEGETLLVQGELAIEAPEGMEASHAEVQVPRYRRAFTLSRELDSAKSDASFKDGVLRLRIPKAEHAQPRRVEVKVT